MLFENIVDFVIKYCNNKDVSDLQLYLNILIMFGYIFLTRMIWKEKNQTDIISVIACFIFAVQQLQLFIRFSPVSRNDEKVLTEFQVYSLIQLLSFTTLIGTFLPLKKYMPTTVVIYSAGFWAAYFSSDEASSISQVVFKFIIHSALNLSVAFTFEYSLSTAHMSNFHLTEVLKQQFNGLIVFDQH